jgi:hypothetical protein
MNSKTEVVNVSDEKISKHLGCLIVLRNKLLCLGSKSIAIGCFACRCVEAKNGNGSNGN